MSALRHPVGHPVTPRRFAAHRFFTHGSVAHRFVERRRTGRVAGWRLATFAVAGVLAVTALAGCRTETAKDAAYVGNTRYSVSDVDAVLAGYQAKRQAIEDEKKNASPDAPRTPRQLPDITPDMVIGDMVYVEIAKRYAAEQHFATPAVNYALVSRSLGLPDSDPLVRLFAEDNAYTTLLYTKVTPITPTDGNYREIYDLLVAKHYVQPGVYQQAKAQLMQYDAGRAVAVRNALADASRRYGTEINPRYHVGGINLPVPVTDPNQPDVVRIPLDFGNSHAPVRDLPVTVPDVTFQQ